MEDIGWGCVGGGGRAIPSFHHHASAYQHVESRRNVANLLPRFRCGTHPSPRCGHTSLFSFTHASSKSMMNPAEQGKKNTLLYVVCTVTHTSAISSSPPCGKVAAMDARLGIKCACVRGYRGRTRWAMLMCTCLPQVPRPLLEGYFRECVCAEPRFGSIWAIFPVRSDIHSLHPQHIGRAVASGHAPLPPSSPAPHNYLLPSVGWLCVCVCPIDLPLPRVA